MKKTIRLLLPALAFAVVIAFTTAASAADHERVTGTFGFMDSWTCADPMMIEGTYDEVMHTFYDDDGNPVRFIFTGKVTITYTNLVTGVTYSPNSSGPGTTDVATGVTVIRGSNGAVFDNSDNLISTNGRVVLDDKGFIISLTGHQVDVCSRLAGH